MLKRLIITAFVLFLFFAFTTTVYLQSNSNTNVNTAVGQVVPENRGASPPSENPRVKNIREGLKTIADGSKELSGWCLLVIAGSIALIVQTSNSSPRDKGFRSIYLLFVPGWLFLAYSMYGGNLVARSYMAAALTSNLETLLGIGADVNVEFDSQLWTFQVGLAFFIVWLLVYMFWWIYIYQPKDETKSS